MTFSANYLKQTQQIIEELDHSQIERMAKIMADSRDSGGRLFIIGSGGGAGHASHAVCDFRKLGGFEAYCPSDNVSHLTATINDEGWENSTRAYLLGSKLNSKDCVLVFSVGGGDEVRNISANLVNAVRLAKEVGAKVVGVVGRDGGYTARAADACVIVPTVDAKHVTPHTESFQALVWHLLVSHPDIKKAETKWESTAAAQTKKPDTQILTVKLFADGAERGGMLEMYNNPLISGFTTNPTLMKKAGIQNYKEFAKDILALIPDKPISFEVFSDDFTDMERQANEIATWGKNVYVKIPITNTKNKSSNELVGRLTKQGIKVNVTAIMTSEQVTALMPYLAGTPAAYVSVFAGRIADSGRDPIPVMKEVLKIIKPNPNIELIWASPRELLNVMQANEIGCHIITATNDILKKLPLLGKDLNTYSLETVQMFRTDAVSAGFQL